MVTVTYPLAWDAVNTVDLPEKPTFAWEHLQLHVIEREWQGKPYRTRYLIRPRGTDDPTPVAEAIHWDDRKRWPGTHMVQCHTGAKSHPWNKDREMPGFHQCGVCKQFAWIECHGMATGRCEHCGHSG